MNLVTEGIVKQGYLVKSPPSNKLGIARWCQRWFVLYDEASISFDLDGKAARAILYYFDNKENFGKGRKPKGQINLDACNAVGRHDGSFQGREHVIELSTEERVFFLCAENEEDRNSWISILNQYTQRNSFDKEDDDIDKEVNRQPESYAVEEPSPLQLELERLKEEREKRRSQRSDTLSEESGPPTYVNVTPDVNAQYGDSHLLRENETYRERSSSAGDRDFFADKQTKPMRRSSSTCEHMRRRQFSKSKTVSSSSSFEFYQCDSPARNHKDADAPRISGCYESSQINGNFGNKLCSQDQNDAEEEFTFSGPKLYQSKSLKREKNLAKSQLNPGGQKHADEELSFTGPKLFASKSLKRGSHKNMINYIEELNKDPQEEQCENSGGEDESEKNSIGSKFRVSKYRGLRAASFLEEVRASLDQQSPDDIGS